MLNSSALSAFSATVGHLTFKSMAMTTTFCLVGFSPVENFPQAEFAPYKEVDYDWNPAVSY